MVARGLGGSARRVVAKTYVACVVGWPVSRSRRTLRDALKSGVGGRIHVASRRSPDVKAAVTDVKVLERRGDRTMLELSLKTGRTHQARVQLAHAGAAIAGDEEYGGVAAPRLLLHARNLALRHPASGAAARFTAPVPADFARWLSGQDDGGAVYDDRDRLDQALRAAVDRRWVLGRGDGSPRTTTAFRLVNEEGDALPRLAVDVYGSWLVAQFYGDNGPWSDLARRERVLDRLTALGFDGVYLKVRPKQSNALDEGRREQLAPRRAVRGVDAPPELEVLEEGLPLVVRLGDGLSTGIFLDQRANRRRVRELATGKRVANLFAYTCAFTLAAAVGGARSTVSVDVSVPALERGRAALGRAGVLAEGRHAFVADDAFAWLARSARRGDRFDFVILDPPSYSTSKRGRFVAETDYAELAAAALGVVAPGGRLLACTNHRGITPSRFRRILFDACRLAGRDVVQLKDLALLADFPVRPGGQPNTKSALLTVGP